MQYEEDPSEYGSTMNKLGTLGNDEKKTSISKVHLLRRTLNARTIDAMRLAIVRSGLAFALAT